MIDLNKIFNFSDAINEVDDMEKKRLKPNNNKIKNKIFLSIFFHQLQYNFRKKFTLTIN